MTWHKYAITIAAEYFIKLVLNMFTINGFKSKTFLHAAIEIMVRIKISHTENITNAFEI